jgi:hypothetical protein
MEVRVRSAQRFPWQLVAAAVTFVALAVVAAAAVRSYSAYRRTRAVEAEALQAHGGDAVEALIAYVDSDRHALADRNLAIWKLGQLGDVRAVPVLEALRTGEPCDHARFVCQRELEKALEKLAAR